MCQQSLPLSSRSLLSSDHAGCGQVLAPSHPENFVPGMHELGVDQHQPKSNVTKCKLYPILPGILGSEPICVECPKGHVRPQLQGMCQPSHLPEAAHTDRQETKMAEGTTMHNLFFLLFFRKEKHFPTREAAWLCAPGHTLAGTSRATMIRGTRIMQIVSTRLPSKASKIPSR